MSRIIREYYPYWEWEEYTCEMWRSTTKQEEEELLKQAIEFTGDYKKYGEYMIQAVDQWPISCAQNLSCTGMNRQAWIGHAACCIALNCPEHITRKAWHHLTQEQQDLANAEADKAIKYWETDYAKRG